MRIKYRQGVEERKREKHFLLPTQGIAAKTPTSRFCLHLCKGSSPYVSVSSHGVLSLFASLTIPIFPIKTPVILHYMPTLFHYGLIFLENLFHIRSHSRVPTVRLPLILGEHNSTPNTAKTNKKCSTS
jgi:hypothetical protein